jgi:2-polyprenyl-6-methoxyphenol hydroxylase-like FAD-dependent oxidoreductase
VIIAGGGIGGLVTALTLRQIGVPCIVFEAVRELRPLGVGINLQPNAVRELYDLGLGSRRWSRSDTSRERHRQAERPDHPARKVQDRGRS